MRYGNSVEKLRFDAPLSCVYQAAQSVRVRASWLYGNEYKVIVLRVPALVNPRPIRKRLEAPIPRDMLRSGRCNGGAQAECPASCGWRSERGLGTR